MKNLLDPGAWQRFVELSMRASQRRAAAASTSPQAERPRAAPVLTHHDVMDLVAPFVRRGHRPDLATSDRQQRRLVFQPRQHAAAVPGLPALHESLELQSPRPGRFRLQRRVSDEMGLSCTLMAEGARPDELLERIEAVPVERHWHVEPGFVAARSLLVDEAAPHAEPLLTGAQVRLEAMTLTMQVPETPGVPARIEIGRTTRGLRALPEDLLAVLGWSWSTLQRAPGGFVACLKLHGGRGHRSEDAEGKLLATARHLARTLAEPPRAFHRRLFLARWGVALRRAIPVGVGGMLATMAAAAEPLDLPLHSPPALLLVGAPLALLVLYFLRGAAPRIEWPRLPRAERPGSWKTEAGDAD